MKKDFLLYIAISIPIFMILIIAFNVMYYKDEKNSEQNFLYTILNTSTQQICIENFKANILMPYEHKSLSNHNEIDCSKLPIYLYHSADNSSKMISLSQAEELVMHTPKINDSKKRTAVDWNVSSDGYSIRSYCHQDFGLGWWGEQKTFDICLIKNNYQKSLNIPTTNAFNFVFIGWVNGDK